MESVFKNFRDYVITLLKDIFLAVIFMLMWVVLVGLLAGTFIEGKLESERL